MYVRRCRPSLRPIVALDRRSVLPRRTREHPRISARSITTPAASRPAAALRAYKLRERSLPIRPLHATSRSRHGHGHGHDDVAELSSITGVRITWIGAWSNIGLCGIKAVAGVLGNSSAMISDAAHSMSDLLSDFITLWALKHSRKPKDADFPYGRGKLETIASFALGGILIGTAGGIAWHSATEIISPDPAIPTNVALWTAVVSILVKEALFHITARIAKKERSSVLLANAWHHRVDSISSFVALAGIIGAQLGFPALDPLAGIAVAGLIFKVGYSMTLTSIHELTDRNVEQDLLAQVREVLTTIEGVMNTHKLRARKMGHYTLVDLHIRVPSHITVSAAHMIAEDVRIKVLTKLPQIEDVLVHVDPEDDEVTEDRHPATSGSLSQCRPPSLVESDVKRTVASIPGVIGVSNILTHYLNNRIIVHFNLELDATLTLNSASEIGSRARKAVLESVKDINEVKVSLSLPPFPKCATLTLPNK